VQTPGVDVGTPASGEQEDEEVGLALAVPQPPLALDHVLLVVSEEADAALRLVEERQRHPPSRSPR
jgi:hypothetical protein